MKSKVQQLKPLEEMTSEELEQALCDMIESTPREIAVNWLQTCLIPMLEEIEKRGRNTAGDPIL